MSDNAPTARKHHYNPKMLLSGFTHSGRKTGALYQFDARYGLKSLKVPRAVAWELDYYAVNLPGHPSDIFESTFGRIESHITPLLRRISTEHRFPARRTTDFGDLMLFLTLMHLRGPRWRELIASVEEMTANQRLRLALSTPERWEAVEDAMQRAGVPSNPVPYAEMRAFVEEHGYGVSIANPGEFHVNRIAESFRYVPELLGKRAWTVLVAENGIPDLISSDSPVTLDWTIPMPRNFGLPGLRVSDSEFAIALSRRVALVGRFEDQPDRVESATERRLTTINGRTAGWAKRFVYAASDDFKFSYGDGPIQTSGDWFVWRRAIAGE